MTILTSQNQTTTITINQTGLDTNTNAWFVSYSLIVRTVIPDAVISNQTGVIDFPDVQTFINSWNSPSELIEQSIQRVISAVGITEWQGVEGSPNTEAPWVTGQAVNIGAIRTYNSLTYICRQLHITQASWAPDVTPALWQLYQPPLSAWVQPTGGHNAYALGARVTHNGQSWESTVNDNVWEPGVVANLWIQI